MFMRKTMFSTTLSYYNIMVVVMLSQSGLYGVVNWVRILLILHMSHDCYFLRLIAYNQQFIQSYSAVTTTKKTCGTC